MKRRKRGHLADTGDIGVEREMFHVEHFAAARIDRSESHGTGRRGNDHSVGYESEQDLRVR
ncbi:MULTISPECIES: hypothetical protein [unclassified Pyramidobacter]|uniref:hypothetical protein n=1 Tax=unclassified Pyramidobacter TaxID=2632171 RepID=UPI0013151758|nr:MULTISPECIES: hypothetical protein [unclassified Pyramidobacter]WOL40316.1 hypothetical protein RAH42_01455 [Pyramidobacter sp. YE332]